MQLGTGWAKSLSFVTGQAPVMKYHRELMQAILNDRCQIAKAVNATVITLDDAPRATQQFDSGRGEEVRHRPARADQRLIVRPRAAAVPRALQRLGRASMTASDARLGTRWSARRHRPRRP